MRMTVGASRHHMHMDNSERLSILTGIKYCASVVAVWWMAVAFGSGSTNPPPSFVDPNITSQLEHLKVLPALSPPLSLTCTRGFNRTVTLSLHYLSQCLFNAHLKLFNRVSVACCTPLLPQALAAGVLIVPSYGSNITIPSAAHSIHHVG